MELHGLIGALCDALVDFDPASFTGADCKVLAESLGRAANACEMAGAHATAGTACGHVTAPMEWFPRGPVDAARKRHERRSQP